MRVQKEFIETISKKIVRSLIDKDLIIWEETTEKLETIISGIITEDLMVEDLLNEEVKTKKKWVRWNFDNKIWIFFGSFQRCIGFNKFLKLSRFMHNLSFVYLSYT